MRVLESNIKPPSHRPGGNPAPLEKLAEISSPVENYTPIFVPAENDYISEIPTTKYSVIFSIPTEFFDLKTIELKSPAIKKMGISPSSFSPLFSSPLAEEILPGLRERDVISLTDFFISPSGNES